MTVTTTTLPDALKSKITAPKPIIHFPRIGGMFRIARSITTGFIFSCLHRFFACSEKITAIISTSSEDELPPHRTLILFVSFSPDCCKVFSLKTYPKALFFQNIITLYCNLGSAFIQLLYNLMEAMNMQHSGNFLVGFLFGSVFSTLLWMSFIGWVQVLLAVANR